MKEFEQTLQKWTERDLTAAAEAHALSPAFGREDEIARVAELLGSGRHPVVSGEGGVGKSAIITELVRRSSATSSPSALSGKQVLQISFKALASTLTKPSNQMGPEFQKLVRALLASAPTVVPYFRDLHVAYAYDLESQLVQLALGFDGPILAEGETGRLRAMFEGEAELEQHFLTIPVAEPTIEAMRDLLHQWADGERRRGIDFEPEALETAIELSHRFLTRGRLPRKALEILQHAGASVGTGPVTARQIIRRFQETYRVPALLVDPEVPFDPGSMRTFFRCEVLEQDEAVGAVVRMMSLIKAGLSDPRRPFGAFLFVGPTGVGKTHVAQILAEQFFGSRDRLVRLNMADYPAPEGCSVLFGVPGAYQIAARRGQLAAKLQGYPFGVVLLDEFEKAHSTVHDRFLQLLDEGVFINGAGESISCRALVFIATSNAGADVFRTQPFGFRGSAECELDRELDRKLLDHFRLEFLNRFDQVVHFHPLSMDGIREIALREIRSISTRSGIRSHGVRVEVDNAVLEWVTANGYHPHFGARFLRRTIERHVTTALADCLVAAPARPSRVVLTVRDGQIVAQPADRQAPVVRLPALAGDVACRSTERPRVGATHPQARYSTIAE